MRIAIAALVIAAVAGPLRAQAPSRSADSAAIVDLELELSRLLEAGAWDAYATHLTADYALTTIQGTLEPRAEALAGWRVRGAGVHMVPTDMWVRVYGDAAILTAIVSSGSAQHGHRARITKTFIRENGHWLLAALHSSLIPDSNPRER